MKLSLSTRIAESFSDKEKAAVPFEDFSELAKDNGYHAICMRASVAGTHSSKERVVEVRRILDSLDLKVSMVTGDFAIPENLERGPQRVAKHHTLPRPCRSLHLLPDADMHEEGGGHRLDGARL